MHFPLLYNKLAAVCLSCDYLPSLPWCNFATLLPYIFANAIFFLDYKDVYYYYLLHENSKLEFIDHLLVSNALYIASLIATIILGKISSISILEEEEMGTQRGHISFSSL